jgi:hypothetical protein
MAVGDSGLITLALILGALVLMVLLAYTPGKIARKRGHPSAEAIRICGVVGVLFWPLWLFAYIWAHTGEDRSAPADTGEPDYHLGINHNADDPALSARSRRERRRAQ